MANSPTAQDYTTELRYAADSEGIEGGSPLHRAALLFVLQEEEADLVERGSKAIFAGGVGNVLLHYAAERSVCGI